VGEGSGLGLDTVQRASSQRKLFHPGKGQHSGHIAGFGHKCPEAAGEFASDLKLPIQDHEHRIRGIPLVYVDFVWLERKCLGLADEPGDLIIRQIREYRQAKKF
jgi:hypothetical protein